MRSSLLLAALFFSSICAAGTPSDLGEEGVGLYLTSQMSPYITPAGGNFFGPFITDLYCECGFVAELEFAKHTRAQLMPSMSFYYTDQAFSNTLGLSLGLYGNNSQLVEAFYERQNLGLDTHRVNSLGAGYQSLKPRTATWLIGLALRAKSDRFSASIAPSSLQGSAGLQLDASTRIAFDFLGGEILLKADAKFFDRFASDYYWGVATSEAQGALEYYNPGSSMLLESGIDLRKAVSEHLVAIIGLQHNYYSEEIINSPIVDFNRPWSLKMGFSYAL